MAFEVGDDEAMDRSSLHVQNCTFQGNQAEDEGGALYSLRIKSVTIASCRFEDNESEENDGGGAYVQRPQEDADDVLAAASRLDVRDTIFRANEAKEKDSGGGLYAQYRCPTSPSSIACSRRTRPRQQGWWLLRAALPSAHFQRRARPQYGGTKQRGEGERRRRLRGLRGDDHVYERRRRGQRVARRASAVPA